MWGRKELIYKVDKLGQICTGETYQLRLQISLFQSLLNPFLFCRIIMQRKNTIIIKNSILIVSGFYVLTIIFDPGK